MTRIISNALIRRPVEEVYEYVTTANNWPEWHPSSLGVQGAGDYSMEIGEIVTENFQVAGRNGSCVWTVVEREVNRRWSIQGQIVGRKTGGKVSYSLRPHPEGTSFEREFAYSVPLRYRLLDWLVVRRKVQAESDLALRRLKARLEKVEAKTGS